MPGSSGIVGGIQAMRSAALASTPSRASIATAAEEEEEKPAAIAWKAAEEKPAAIAYDDGTAPAPIDVIGEKILRAIWMNRTRGKNRRYTSVTPSMLRRSRPVVGNVERLRLLGAKLRAGRCVHMLVIGASVSMGRNVGGVNAAWHARYIDYLNARYPCKASSSSSSSSDRAGHAVQYGEAAADGARAKHRRTLMLLGATGTAYAANTLRAWLGGWKRDNTGPAGARPPPFDLVIVEFGANDGGFSGIVDEHFDASLAWWTARRRSCGTPDCNRSLHCTAMGLILIVA